MRTAIQAGSTSFNSGYFYGNAPNVTANLKLLSRFFDAHPDLVDKVYISVKGGLGEGMTPNADLAFLRQQLEEVNSILKHRKMDLFEMARVDKATGIEQVRPPSSSPLVLVRRAPPRFSSLTLLCPVGAQTMKNLLVLRDEGLFRDIGLSEWVCSLFPRRHRHGS